MQDPMSLMNGLLAVIAHMIGMRTDAGNAARDHGAVSIEQVLWYAAAAVSVAVVAAIIWSQIRTTASTPVQSPSAP